MTKNITIPSILLLVTLVSCGPAEPVLTNDQLYDNAVKDAVFAEEDEIMHLVEIVNDDENVLWDNGRVLMCTFHHYPSSYPEGETITTDWGEGWLTSVKEFSNWYKKEKGKFKDYLMRTKQLMGVDPNKAHTHISAFYVNPSDMFRPAYMPDITKQVTELSLPVGADPDYVTWFKENTYYSYFTANPKLPWTRLVYTYDWAPHTDDYGLSEFILKNNSEITITKTLEVEEFYTYLESPEIVNPSL